tara:strand:+ start:16510 stop:16653 length:144 start_codon:yes stop_codon:yes gene_type:complete
MKYCGQCYTADIGTYPFGFCHECWVKAGSPKTMKMKALIREANPPNI